VSVSPVSPAPVEEIEGGLEHAPEMEADAPMTATLFPPREGYEEVLGSVPSPLTNMPPEDLPEVLNSGYHPEMEAGVPLRPPRSGYEEVMASPVPRPVELSEGRPPRPPGPTMNQGRGW